MAYSDKVLDHYENPRNVGSFAKNADDVGTGMVGAPACGDVMRLQIKVGDGQYEKVLWTSFSQEDLKRFAKVQTTFSTSASRREKS